MSKFLFLVGFCLLSAALVKAAFDKEKEKEHFLKVAETCRVESGASKEEFEQLVKHQPASTKEGKCLRSCIMKHFEWMDASGKLNHDGAIKCINKVFEGAPDKIKIAVGVIEECVKLEVPSDHCEAAEQYGKCLKESAIKQGVTEFSV